MRVLFLHGGARHDLLRDVARGTAPDTGLRGSNWMPRIGIDPDVRSFDDLAAPGRAGPPGRLDRWAHHLRTLRQLRVVRQYDLVFSTAGLSLLLAKALLRWTRPRWVLLCFDLLNWLRRHHGRGRRIRARLLRQADAIICLSSDQVRLFRDEGLDEARVRFVPWGVDATFFAPVPPDAQAPRYVLSVGTDLGRDYATLVRALGGVDIPVKLVTFKRNLGGLSLPGNIEHLTGLSYLELRALYAGAAFVVIPTIAEGRPYGSDYPGQTVLLEAMAMEKAAIISERHYVRDYMMSGRTGEWVKPEDPEALRHATLNLWADPERARSMGQAGRRLVEERFNSSAFAQDVAEIFREVVTR